MRCKADNREKARDEISELLCGLGTKVPTAVSNELDGSSCSASNELDALQVRRMNQSDEVLAAHAVAQSHTLFSC